MPTVLVVDDDPSIRELVQEVLVGEGCQVHVAADGAEGVRALARIECDLLITDIVMPNQDGLETILALHRSRPDLPILAISGGGRYGWTDALEAAASFGASRTLTKPFSVQALRTCVRELLAEHGDAA